VKKSSLIGHTAEVYDLVLRDTRPADSLIDTFFRSHKYLGSHDRRFIAETMYGMLRHKKRIDWLLQAHQEKFPQSLPGNKSLLACLAYLVVVGNEEVGMLVEEIKVEVEDVPAINVILNEAKNLDTEFHATSRLSLGSKERLSLQYSFPEWMIEHWLQHYGEDETTKLCEALNQPAPLTLRVNTLKTTVEKCQEALAKENIRSERTELSPFGLKITKRMNIFQLKIFQEGFFEVQDEGSQLVSLLVDPKPTSKVVDACAGGGGKSLALAAVMKNRGVIHALDTNTHRLEALRKRIRRSGVDTIRVRPVEEHILPPDLLNTADNVLIDAPCSGLGTIRRNPGMKWSVNPESIAELNAKQSSILRHYAMCVKPSGRLVYATCTMMKAENDDVVENFLAEHREFEIMEPSSILKRYHLESLAKEKYFQLLPHTHGTDGFFAVVMRRKS
jgi:16S rRNA (cytosine967-C5)-methyltransferase